MSFLNFSDSINMTILGTPKILVAEQDGKKNVRLMWSKVNSAAGYEVWKYDDETSQYVLHRKLSATDIHNNSLNTESFIKKDLILFITLFLKAFSDEFNSVFQKFTTHLSIS